MILVLAASGKARAGKDTLVNPYMAARGFKRMSYADELKSRVRRDFKLTMEHTDGKLKEEKLAQLNGHSTRELLIDYGTSLFRKFKPDYWVDCLVEKIRVLPDGSRIAITDARFPNEIDILRRIPNVQVIAARLERHPSRDAMVDEATKNSVSETALDGYTLWDLILPARQNETPQDLEKFADRIMDYVNKITTQR